MNIKRFVVLVLTLCFALSLCACGGNNNETASTGDTQESTQQTTESTDDGTVTYTVKVVDEGGNAVVGAMVQICSDKCLPGITDAEGVAKFVVAEDEYKASVLSAEGYAVDTTENYYFDDGSYELTITLQAVA